MKYHLFWLTSTSDYFYSVSGAARNSGGNGVHRGYDHFAGSELNLVATYKIATFGVLQAGYGHFFHNYVKESLTAAASP